MRSVVALVVPTLITVAFLARFYGDSSSRILADIESFGSARDPNGTVPPHHPSLQENVRCSLQYAALTTRKQRKTSARCEGVTALAWRWGVSIKQPRRYWIKNMFGKNIYRLKRLPCLDRIMDNPHLEQVLIGILKTKKGRVSIRRTTKLFQEKSGVNVSMSTLLRKLHEMKAIVTKQQYVPMLTPVHKPTRYFYGGKLLRERFRYWVDIDEKWFFVVRCRGWVWILPDHMDPDTCRRLPVQSKRYITKVMFLTAVARPIFDSDGKCIFDGKVGMWRVCDYAQRKRNYTGKRLQYKEGDWYVKDASMGAVKYVEMVTELLLPAIEAIRVKYWFPLANGSPFVITVQHDGAPGHRADGIERSLNAAFAAIGAVFRRQPPKSPDANMLDMCVFNSLEATVSEFHYATKAELYAAVWEAWVRLYPNKLEKMWACSLSRTHSMLF